MQGIKKHYKTITQGIVLGLLTAAALFLGQAAFSPEGLGQQWYREFVFENSVSSVDAYQKRNFDYRGACEDIPLRPYITCSETGDTYRLFTNRVGGPGFYCADSSGYQGIIESPRSDWRLCLGE